VYKGLELGNYGLVEFEYILADLIPLYEKTYLFGDFNIDLLDSDGSLYAPFVNILNLFMPNNVSLRPTRPFLNNEFIICCWVSLTRSLLE
jgi:hypothetical protein